MQLFWRNGNDVVHINKAKLHRSRIVLGLVMFGFGGSTNPVFIQATQDHSAIIAWVGAVLVINGFSHHWGRNG